MKDMLVGSWPFWMEHGGRRRDLWFNRDSRFVNHACNGDRKRNFGSVNGPVWFFDWFSSFRARIVDLSGLLGTPRKKNNHGEGQNGREKKEDVCEYAGISAHQTGPVAVGQHLGFGIQEQPLIVGTRVARKSMAMRRPRIWAGMKTFRKGRTITRQAP